MPRKHKRLRANARPTLYVEQILAWADEFHETTGEWPGQGSGPIAGTVDEKWRNVDQSLRAGRRGLPGGLSIARLLALHRGARNRKALPPLTTAGILAWADLHHERTGTWPQAISGPIIDAPGETWMAVDMALRVACRGLSGGSSLCQLLAAERSSQHLHQQHLLTVDQILAWADAHHTRTGQWPTTKSGAISEAPHETWVQVDDALARGLRGLPKGSSLHRLLKAHHRIPSRIRWARLEEEDILIWAEAHHARTGHWPISISGAIPEAPGMTWLIIHLALKKGKRGFPGGSTLGRFLVERGRGRNRKSLPAYCVETILKWADHHSKTTGQWPTAKSGPISAAPGETWMAVQVALQQGRRGLPGGTTLAWLLAERRSVPPRIRLR